MVMRSLRWSICRSPFQIGRGWEGKETSSRQRRGEVYPSLSLSTRLFPYLGLTAHEFFCFLFFLFFFWEQDHGKSRLA